MCENVRRLKIVSRKFRNNVDRSHKSYWVFLFVSLCVMFFSGVITMWNLCSLRGNRASEMQKSWRTSCKRIPFDSTQIAKQMTNFYVSLFRSFVRTAINDIASMLFAKKCVFAPHCMVPKSMLTFSHRMTIIWMTILPITTNDANSFLGSVDQRLWLR